jgi:Mrp family chromosome partitioning ATPase
MSRLIEREFGHAKGSGVCLAFSSPDSDKVTANAILMLAYSLQSELGSKVLILDARLKNQAEGVTGRLGLLNAPGFAEVMRAGYAGNQPVLRHTRVPNVDVLPAGSARSGMAMSMNPQGFRRLLEAAKARYDHVLVQVGSVLNDTRNLTAAAAVGSVFLFVEENKTLMKALDDSRKLLLSNGVTDVRVVVTGREP